MSITAIATLGYISWVLLLILTNELLRSYAVIRHQKAPNSFLQDGTDLSPFAHRLARAHANCYESFPIIVGPLLLALATDQAALTDPLALWVLGARLAQSSVHLVSTSNPAVNARFVLFAIQLLVATWWVIMLWIALTSGAR